MSKNCQKLDIFFKKIAKKYFEKKNQKFLAIFFVNVKVLAFFRQSNGNFSEGQVGSTAVIVSFKMFLITPSEHSGVNSKNETATSINVKICFLDVIYI